MSELERFCAVYGLTPEQILKEVSNEDSESVLGAVRETFQPD